MNSTELIAPPPIAIIGLGCLFPQAGDAGRFWSNIQGRVDAITEVPPSHWRPEDYFDGDPKKPDHTYARRGGFLSPVDFPALDFGITPNALEATDSTQLLGLMVARQALEDGGYGSEGKPFDRGRVGVILGVTGTLELVIPLGARLGHPLWRKALKDAGVRDDVAQDVVERIAAQYVGWQEDSFPGLLGNVVAGRIANRLDLGGTNCVVDAACASSLSAVHLALFELATGRADMVLTGGMDTFNDIFMYMCFSKTPALSPSGDARPFDAGADGTILGEGLGCLLLKRLSDAERDGDRVYAVIKGVGTSSDGKGQAIYAPSPAGQARALRQAYQLAGVTPETIHLVEGHGTGTRAGDAAEVKALADVYRSETAKKSWCALGSVKSQIGHTKAAAGAAGLIKTALALYHKVLPPTIKVGQPIDVLTPGQGPFYVNTEARPWLPAADHPRRAAVSSFGFGGSNFHCVLEEHRPEKAAIDWDGDLQILAFSAETEDRLLAAVEAFPTAGAWEELRQEAARGRATFHATEAFRLLLVLERGKSDPVKLLGGMRGLLKTFTGRTSWATADGVFFGSGPVDGKVAILFPGQGSQYAGMMRELACRFPAMQQALAEAETVFAEAHDGRLTDRVYPPPAFRDEERARQEEALRQTDVAQPALAAVELGAYRLLTEFGVRAEAFAGHSFGELTALCAADVFPGARLHRLARLRGHLMASGTGDRGAMLAVQALADAVEKLLREEKLSLAIANRNTPRQVVLSGTSAEIRRAADACGKRGLLVKVLPVAAAFHSPLVADVRRPFAEALEEVAFHTPTVPVFSNTTGATYPGDAAAARSLLAGQLAAPVEFVQEILGLHRWGARTFVEVGPAAKLTGMVAAILEGKPHATIAIDASSGQRGGVADLARTLAQLAARGHAVDLRRWDASAPAATKKPTLTVPIGGANYVKPHAPLPPKVIGTPAAAYPSPVLSPVVASPPRIEAPAVVMATPTPPSSTDSTMLAQALRATQDNLAALQKLGEQTARLHGQFLDNQTQALAAFQKLLEQQQGLMRGTPVVPSLAIAPPVALPITPLLVAPPRPVVPPAPIVALEVDPAAVADDSATADVLVAVVSEKTGYPAEMLNLDMELDTDLGIDSIKRVEIFSVLQEKLPHAPAVTAEHLGSLRSLRDVVIFLGGRPGLPFRASPEPQHDVQLSAILLEVVSAKTGYPAEMLNLDMDLDTDLGIDSIKRIEIFSLLQEKLPQAPVIEPQHLGSLRSLRDVAVFLGGAAEASAPTVSEKPLPAKVGPVAVPALQRYVLQAAPLPDARPAIESLNAGDIWVTDDDTGLSSLITARLGLLGHRATLLRRDDFSTAAPPAALAGVIIVAPPNAGDGFSRDAFRLLQIAAPGLRNGAKAGGSILATVSRLDGAFGLRGSANSIPSGGLAGLTKTASHEWPEVHCKALDLSPDLDPDEAALAVVDELLHVGPIEVGIGPDGRIGLHLADLPLLGAATFPLDHGDVVVISGGARGVTAEAAVALAQRGCTLVLLGRGAVPSPEPEWLAPLLAEADIKKALLSQAKAPLSPRELGEQYRRVLADRDIRLTLQRIQQTGARAEYHALDVRDERAVGVTLSDVRSRLGPVRGLVHGAGVLADRRIEDKTLDQFDAVYSTKVDGLRALLRATADDDLKALAVFSSSTARFGRTGQIDYAMANEVLNKIAQQEARRRPNCRVVAVNWGPWDGGMVTPALKTAFESEGVGVIPLLAGAEHLVRELGQPGPVEVVVLGGGSLPERASVSLPAVSDLPLAFERAVSVEALPILRSHVIAGRAVLPMALIVEWLAHGALHGNPGLAFHGFDDLRVLKGVRLAEGQTWNLRVRAGKAIKEDSLYRVPVELTGAGTDGRDILHARAAIVLAQRLPAAPEAAPASAMPASHRATADIYRDLLFHGPELQGIRELQGSSEQGILALVAAAPPPSDWLRQPLRGAWLADPLALDCAFQMMIVWSFDNHGCGSLPAHAGAYRQYRRAFPREGVRVLAEVTRDNPHRALADLWFVDAAGAVVAHMKDYECVIDASLNQAFRRNQLMPETASP